MKMCQKALDADVDVVCQPLAETTGRIITPKYLKAGMGAL